MIKRIHFVLFLSFVFCLIILQAGCDNATQALLKETDLIAKHSPSAFDEVTSAMNPTLVPQEGEADLWVFTVDNGNGFKFSTNFTNAIDQVIFLEAKPFIQAGLDVTKLENPYFFDIETNTLNIEIAVSDKTFDAKAAESPELFFVELLDKERNKVEYGMSSDLYMIHGSAGNMIDFARKPKENSKDILFVLNPDPLVKAGLDPQKLEAWNFGLVTSHVDGKTVEVERLTQSHNLL